MTGRAEIDEAHATALVCLKDQLLAALELSERTGEFLPAAQIAIALESIQRSLSGRTAILPEPREVGVRAG